MTKQEQGSLLPRVIKHPALKNKDKKNSLCLCEKKHPEQASFRMYIFYEIFYLKIQDIPLASYCCP
jgi:hypothetical protein